MTTTITMPPTAGSTARLLSATGTVRIADITLDGNRAARGWPGGYEWEQSALVRMVVGSLEVQRVHFANSAGDGLLLVENVTATITDTTAQDCFRGAITCVAGGTSVTVTRHVGSWFQCEMEPLVNPSEPWVDITLTDCRFPEGVELETYGEVIVTGCNLGRRFWIYGAGDGSARFTDCQIGLTKQYDAFPGGEAWTTEEQASIFGCSIFYPRDVVFTGCTFTGEECGLELRPAGAVDGPKFTGQHVTFDACTFIGPGSGIAVYNWGDDPESGRTNTVEFRNGCTYVGYDTGYELRSGAVGTLIGSLSHA